jgi:hypothetical protein
VLRLTRACSAPLAVQCARALRRVRRWAARRGVGDAAAECGRETLIPVLLDSTTSPTATKLDLKRIAPRHADALVAAFRRAPPARGGAFAG